MTRLVHLVQSLLVAVVSVAAQKFEGEVCAAGPNLFGTCARVESCASALADIRNGRKPAVCSYEKEMPIVCCANSNIIGSPAQVMPVWPTEGEQMPTQRPVMGQRPPPQSFGSQGPNQRPPFGQGQNQRPPFGQGQTQRPLTGQGQSGQRPNQQPFGGQGPNQRPSSVQGQNPQSFGGAGQPPFSTAVPNQPPVQSSSAGKPTRRPWWQIPNRKTTESPAVIDNLATLPMRQR